jgi:hypothetical protein
VEDRRPDLVAGDAVWTWAPRGAGRFGFSSLDAGAGCPLARSNDVL